MNGAARPGTLGTLGVRLVNFTSILAAGTGLGLALAVVRLAVLTRLLEISVYGQLALLVIMATFVTTLVRMAIVTGSLRAVFKGGDEDAGAEEEEAAAQPDSGSDQRRILGTGLVASLILTAILGAGVAAFAVPVDSMLIDSGGRFAVVAATLLGGLDASHRLVSHVSRFERRPVTFVGLQLSHAILGLVAAIVLIEAGYGLEGAIGGLALGSALSLVPALWVSRHRFSLSIDRGHLVMLARLGAPFIAITAGFWVFRHADIFIVSRYLPEADVALYRAAGRIGGVASSLLGGILFAWGPLTQGPLRGALHREGLLEAAGGRLLGYFWLITVWLILALVLTRDLLIRVAPAEYRDAAVLIALLGAAAVSVTGFILVYRTSRMKRKRPLLIALLALMSPVLVGLSVLLIPRFGLEGAAAAAIATPLASAGAYLVVSQRASAKPLELPWSRLILGTLVGAAYCTLGVLITGAVGDLGAPLAVVAALGFPAALVASGVLPPREARAIVRLIPLPKRGRGLEEPLSLLGERDLEVLEALLRRREPVSEVARTAERSEEELLGHFVTLLRGLGGIGAPVAIDSAIGRYLLSGDNVNLRDREGYSLALEKGVRSMDVDGLTVVADQLRGMSDRRWKRARAHRSPGGDP